MLLNALASLGHKGIKTLRTFGRAGLMLFNALVGKPEFRKHAPLLVRQLYNVGITTVDGYFRRRGDLGRISGRRQLERH